MNAPEDLWIWNTSHPDDSSSSHRWFIDLLQPGHSLSLNTWFIFKHRICDSHIFPSRRFLNPKSCPIRFWLNMMRFKRMFPEKLRPNIMGFWHQHYGSSSRGFAIVYQIVLVVVRGAPWRRPLCVWTISLMEAACSSNCYARLLAYRRHAKEDLFSSPWTFDCLWCCVWFKIVFARLLGVITRLIDGGIC